MSNLYSYKLWSTKELLKYCFSKNKLIELEVRQYIESLKADKNVVDFLKMFMELFVVIFFEPNYQITMMRTCFNKFRDYVIKQFYIQVSNFQQYPYFTSKMFFDNYYYWLKESGLLHLEKAQEILDSTKDLFEHKYKVLYNREYSDKRE